MQEINYKEITRRMKEARKSKNYTQEQVAKELNCTSAFISNVENNRAKLNLRVLSYYSKCFDLSFEALLSPNFSDTTSSQTTLSLEEATINKELLDILKFYTLEERQKLLHILRIWKTTT